MRSNEDYQLDQLQSTLIANLSYKQRDELLEALKHDENYKKGLNLSSEFNWDAKAELEKLSDKQKHKLLEQLIFGKKQRNRLQYRGLSSEVKTILEDLKNNYVKIDDDKEMLWYKWKFIHVDLPAVWEFEWFKFDFYLSNEWLSKKDFENLNCDDLLYSMEDISLLLNAIRRYIKAKWIDIDEYVDYEKELKDWEYWWYQSEAWDCLKEITGLNRDYWLKDIVKYQNNSGIFPANQEPRRIKLNCHNNTCCFNDYYDANMPDWSIRPLLLKIK